MMDLGYRLAIECNNKLFRSMYRALVSSGIRKPILALVRNIVPAQLAPPTAGVGQET
jgi:hypothetical protein